jgi:hypothetical protein
VSLGPLPAPPSDLRNRIPPTTKFDGSLFRSHSISRHPVHFGKSGRYRFDAPDASYEVLYAGTDLYCAFVEGLVKTPANRIVTTAKLRSTAVSELRATRVLCLIDLVSSAGLLRIGADARLCSADYSQAQIWSKSLHEHPIKADGILYPSRLDPSRLGVALFGDRAPRLVELNRRAWYEPGPQRKILVEIVEHYDLQIIETELVVPRKPIVGASPTPALPFDV